MLLTAAADARAVSLWFWWVRVLDAHTERWSRLRRSAGVASVGSWKPGQQQTQRESHQRRQPGEQHGGLQQGNDRRAAISVTALTVMVQAWLPPGG